MLKLTFKKHKRETGLAGVGNPYPPTDIKLNKEVIGYISGPAWNSRDEYWHVHFSVKKDKPDDNPNCDWKWIELKDLFQSEEDARDGARLSIDQLSEKYTFENLG